MEIASAFIRMGPREPAVQMTNWRLLAALAGNMMFWITVAIAICVHWREMLPG